MDESIAKLLGNTIFNMAEAFVVCAAEPVDLPGPIVLYVNPVFEAMTGYSADEIIGKTCRILQGPDTDRATLARIRASLRECRSIRETVLNYRRDGSPFWAELEIDPIVNESGLYTHWIGVQRLLSERRGLVDHLGVETRLSGIVYCYQRFPDGRECIPFVSEEIVQFFGVTPEDVRHDVAPMFEHVHPADRTPIHSAVNVSATTMETLHLAFRVILPGGRTRRVQAMASPALLPDGSILWNGYLSSLDLKERAINADIKAVLDALPVPVFIKDPESRIVLINEACEERWGASSLELRGGNGLRLFSDDEVAKFREQDRRVFAEGVKAQFDYEFTNRETQTTRVGQTTKKPIYSADGEPRFLVGVTLDLTKQKRIENELRASEERLRGLYEMSRVGFVLIRFSGEFADLNQAFADICGYSRQELLKMRYQDITPSEYRQSDVEVIRELRMTKQCGPVEKQLIQKSGKRITVDAHGSVVAGSDGGQYMWWIAEDITDRKQQFQTQALLAAIVESSTDAIISMSLEGIISTWNPAAERMFGYPALAAVGREITMIVPPENMAEERLILERLRRGERIEQFETIRVSNDGRLLPVMLTISPLYDSERQVIGASKMVRDMSDRNRIEAQLRQAQKMEAVGNLTGGLAHDFNNLLGIILGNLEMLAETRGPVSESSELLLDAIGAAERGAELTRSLLAFARRQPLQPRNIELDGLIDDTIKLVQRLLGAAIDIVTSLETAGRTVLVDPTQFSAALTNLITNARDAMPDGGRITISSRLRHIDESGALTGTEIPPGDYAVIEVGDTGGGIQPDSIVHVFEPFFTTKDRDRGAGLGLSMVYGFIKQSDGYISVSSEVGVGTRLTIHLPSKPEAGAPSMLGEVRDPVGTRGETVLAVEDDKALRRILVRQLGSLGYRVLAASNGGEALAILEANAVDLVFSDVVMPGGMGGLELAHRVRARWPGTRFVLTSGFPELRIDDGFPVTDIRLLNKPYHKSDLASILRQVLNEPLQPRAV